MSASNTHKNILYNIFGAAFPILVTFFTIPHYITTIGEARYGVLALIWIAFGYFGIFDLGLARATAYKISSLKHHNLSERTSVFYTSCTLVLCLGVLSGVLFYTSTLLFGVKLIPAPDLHAEITSALPWVALFFPVALLGGVLGGCLMAEERFFELNLQQSVGSVLLQSLPLFVAIYVGKSLQYVILGALLARTINVAWLAAVCLKWAWPAGRPVVALHHIKSLFQFGGWITVSEIIGPILNGLDQMIIGATLGPKSTAHYAVPFSMASKALIIPSAVSRALFPRLSSMPDAEARILCGKAVTLVAMLMGVGCVPAILFAEPALELWLGKDFALHAAFPTAILLVGMWFNSLANLPYTFLQTIGRPDLIAKIHAFELVPFIALLWWLVTNFGITGAALAWTLRVLADTILMFSYSKFRFTQLRGVFLAFLAVIAAFAVVFLGAQIWLCAIACAVLLVVVAVALIREPAVAAFIKDRRFLP